MGMKAFKIGTRNSPLALRQTDILTAVLKEHHPELGIEIVPILSNADWNKSQGEKPLSEESGGKGLFAKEIEAMLLAGQIDCGAHSLKDMASFLPQGLVIHHVLPRVNPRDAFISAKYKSIHELPQGAKIGSCSARRSAIILSKRPDVEIVPLRGNVQTRLDKIKSGQVDASFLAMAGLERLGLHDNMIHPMMMEEMLPACGQGTICMETRADDDWAHEILRAVHCQVTGFSALAEREVLKALDGSCHTPIAAFSTHNDGHLQINAEVYALDGSQKFQQELKAPCLSDSQAIAIGQQVGAAMLKILPAGILL